ncbi:uncharacterized protein DDB_G0271670 [Nilaparvata lugens]|uniref:uncharacterized protein DDB_G0271670 n=1 Tax=Nilaparvata lugens TaxID=108931 RepID=UPI00193DF5D9|nr:uncharacterized protein DDB_G0271670 [Nilaparvata lugens]XP_039289581.1 uncharacterized protein DDB_G0271670 [Nilaparvata lugens]
MWKTLTRGLRAPFERGPWSNRTSGGEQSTAPNNQENKFHLPCPFRLIPSLLEKCQTYPYLPFCSEQKANQQGAESEGRSDESCKNETLHHQPCGLLGAVGWSGVLVLGWTILQPWYRHDAIRRHQPKLHTEVKHNLKQNVNLSRYQSLYRLLIHPAFSQPLLPPFSTSSVDSQSSVSSSSTSSSVDSQTSVSSSSSVDYFDVSKESSTTDRQLTPDEAFDQAAEEVRLIHERVMGASENRQGVACMSLSQNRKAIEHFRVASRLQYAPAAFNLGQCYELGIGTEQDFTQAAQCYQKASDLGHPTAMYNLGVFYAHGWGGLVADSTHARKLFTRAAMLGQREAQAALNLKPQVATQPQENNFSIRDFFDFPLISSTRPNRNELEIDLQLSENNSSSLPSSSSSSLFSAKSTSTSTTSSSSFSSSPSSTSTTSSSSSSCDRSLSFSPQRVSPVKESSDSSNDSTFSDDEWDLESILDSANGNSATLYRLAVCYEKNPKEEQKPELVLKLYGMAADHGHTKAKKYLEVLEHHKKLGTLDDFLKQRKRSRTSSTPSECAMKN